MREEVETTTEMRVSVDGDGDEIIVRSTARDAATAVGFDETAREEIAIVAMELATNVLVHADSGDLTVAQVTDGEREGIRIESLDIGPGIQNVPEAFADGESTAGSLGGGLGAVNRLMDHVTVTAPGEPNYGTHIVADRWRRPARETVGHLPFSIGAASRPMDPGTANGDSFIIARWNDSALVGVIDGLGHGAKAHEAAVAAKQYVERHYDNDLRAIFDGTERACRGTRGVVMTLARFDWADGTVTTGAVGNINHKVRGDVDLGLVQRRGVVGANGPSPRVSTVDWPTDATLVLFSDGVGSHWDWDEYGGPLDVSGTELAQGLLERHGKDHDDATVLAVTGETDDS